MIDPQLFLLIPVLSSILANIFTHIFAWSYFNQYSERYPLSKWRPTVSIIIPLRGVDEFAIENFRSVFEQNYPNDFEIIFAAEDLKDPIVPIVERTIKEYKNIRSKLVYSNSGNIKSFGKNKNLIAGFRESQYEVVIFIDSDVHVSPKFLLNTVGTIENPKVGLAFAPQICEGAENWIAALQNIAVNTTAIIYASGAFFNLLYALAGSIMAMRREVIESIGGLEKIAPYIADDISLGKAVREAGFKIHLLKQPARIYNINNNFKQFWFQMHRWSVIVCRYFPASPLVAIFVGFPLLWAYLYLGIEIYMGNYLNIGLLVISLVITLQILSTMMINMKLAKDTKLWRFIWVVGLGEIIALPIFIHSLVSNKVLWRGRWLRIKRDLTASVIMESSFEKMDND